MDYKKKYLKYKLKYLTAKKLYGGSDNKNPKIANEKEMKEQGETELKKTKEDRENMLEEKKKTEELARKAEEEQPWYKKPGAIKGRDPKKNAKELARKVEEKKTEELLGTWNLVPSKEFKYLPI